MYKAFIRHAKKITESKAITEDRPALKGVMHYEDGSMAVTDSHRLYFVKDMHDKGEKLVTASGVHMMDEYPKIDRLFPNTEPINSVTYGVNDLIKAADLITTAARVSDGMPVTVYDGSELRFKSTELSATYGLPEPIETMVSGSVDIALNGVYLLDALRLIKALKYREFTLNIHGTYRPFTLTTKDEKLSILLVPIRRA